MAEKAPAPNSSGLYSDLKTRLGPAIIVAVVAFACIWFGGIWIALIAAAAGGMMMAEWRSITAPDDEDRLRSGALYIFAVGWGPLMTYAQGVGMAVFGIVAMAIYGYVRDRRQGQGRAGWWSVLGTLYLGAAGIAFVSLRGVEPFGFLSILWAALVVVAADIGGYFAGRQIGGPKLWPKISPKKTWAGIVGGIVFASAVGGLLSWATTGTYYYQVCTVSALAAMLSQAGDLGESALKRYFDVKDSGDILPGHGGVLDRLDGHSAAILVVAAVTFTRGQPVFVW